MSELSAKLVERCAAKLNSALPYSERLDAIAAILRESGHTKLVAALTQAKSAVSIQKQRGGTHWSELLAKIDDALHQAGSEIHDEI